MLMLGVLWDPVLSDYRMIQLNGMKLKCRQSGHDGLAGQAQACARRNDAGETVQVGRMTLTKIVVDQKF